MEKQSGKKKLALHWKIIIGMVLGVVAGLLLSLAGMGDFSDDWIKPFGTIFLNLLKLIAVPLVFISLVNGVTSLTDVSKLSLMGSRTIGIYILTTVIAISIGLFLVNAFQPGEGFSEEMKTELTEKFSKDTEQRSEAASKVKNKGPLQPLVDLVPKNIISSMSSNSNMLQIITFALLFGTAMVMIKPQDVVQPLKNVIIALDKIIIKMVNIIMLLAPIGVFALLASLIVDFSGGDVNKALELLSVLAKYSLTVVVGLALMMFGVYPLILRFFGGVPIKKFLKGIFPAQMMAFSTSSSAATLPVTMKQVEEELEVSEETASFVLPLGATINMDGTSLYQGVAAVFIAQVYSIPLDLGDQLSIILTATLASIGSAAVPGAGLIMLIIVLEQVGLPVYGIALILAPDRILDMFRTMVNVTGDAAVCTLIERMLLKRKAQEEELAA
ncbi:dicarboxylate/amino acid:cation symporter [Sediminitomix flava]|uniref:Na+/H+-dicarboxylate symporter n=1 Tax=Sediminitomix flava TaxID=379075 RepID=A0A315Z905_SEDFL|nr:dicarboxylate/amino acid:cation symporter [Sediminitomix flava]PWJ40016.1 Na+/H+-dicarboxylate symporter [Sediminitomix flava]